MRLDRSARVVTLARGIILAALACAFLGPGVLTGQEAVPPDPPALSADTADTAAAAVDVPAAGVVDDPAATATATAPADAPDSLATGPPAVPQSGGAPDSVAVAADSLAAVSDSLAAPSDSLAGAVLSDSLAGAVLPDSLAGAVLPDSLAGAALSDSLAGAVLSDSLPGAVLSDSLAGAALSDSLEGAALPDTLAAAGVDSTVSDRGPTIDLTAPREVGVGFPRHEPPPYLRPWETARPTAGGLAVAGLSVPGKIAATLPFKREVVIDLDRETVAVVTTAGTNFRRVSYSAPLEDYVLVAGAETYRSRWTADVARDIGKDQDRASGGFLDIDIPMPLGTEANLKVKGSERITFGGQTSYLVEALESESGRPSRFPQLDMEQQLTVNLEGTIGDKIHVYVDHRSGGQTFGVGKANEIRVHYDGDEDEIIQKIELGEVNLSLPGTEFVSYSGHHEGLFGAKMTAKIGKLDVVTIASKEEGKTSGASFTGTSESDSLVIKDINYKARTFFAVDGPALRRGDRAIQEIDVYIDDKNGGNDIETGAEDGLAYLWSEDGDATSTSQEGNFDQLVELEDYLMDYESGVIEFMRPVPTGTVLAVAYTRFDGYSVGQVEQTPLTLKMIKKEGAYVGEEWLNTRRHELKHIYDLGADDIPEEGFRLIMRKSIPSGEDPETEGGIPYVRILGLDTEGLGGDPTPDGIVDLSWIDFEKGYLIFPHFTPFCPEFDSGGFYPVPADTIYIADELEEPNCAVYEREVFEPNDDTYYMVARYNRAKTTFYLGQINIIENSEVVRLNGVRMTRGADYTIYYPAGQLTLLNEEAKEPDAKVTVEFDYTPFGITGEKTLLGTRGVYNWSDNINIGSTWMYQSKGTPDDRPRLGEEPTRTVVGDVNFSAEFRPELMTRIADAIPFVSTDAESRFKIAAETAVSIPEPNTKGFVSIDDMEGTENISMLGVIRRTWIPSSVPDVPGVDAADRMPIGWYNPDRKWQEGDLFPYLPQQEGDDSHRVLEIDYDATSSASWAGLMRLLSKTGNDYSDYQFLEIWVNDEGTRRGKVHIDLGTISEDYYPTDPALGPNGELDTEDVDRNGFDADEDTGLDNVDGVDADNVAGDDGNDDYKFTFGQDDPDYGAINGTEGNERFDTEDLNGNWYLDTDDRYWELVIDLADTSEYLMQDNSLPPIPASKRTNWRLYRVPLADAVSVNAMTGWTVIKSARIWVEDLEVGSEPLGIGSVDIIGSQWEPEPIRDAEGTIVPEGELGDMTFHVGSKNTKEDSDYAADTPFNPGTDEETNLPKREQSLVLFYENLEPAHSVSARRLFFSEENYTSYQSLQFYVHGDDNLVDNTVFFLRLGADSLNYYEYSLELAEGWLQRIGGSRNRLTIPFKSFTDLKLDPYAEADTVAVWGDTTEISGETFKRVGWPSLSRIRRLTVGVRNENEEGIGDDLTGEVWIDDIRLTDVRKEIGWAERVTIEAKFADLLDVDFDLRHVDGDFHTLKQTRGSGQDNLSFNFSGTLNADRFVSGLGIATPVNVTWKKSTTRPRFSTGSDIVLDKDESEEEKTETVNRSIAASFSRKRQSPSFWTHLLLDGVSLRASYSDHKKTAPTRADTSNTIRARMAYKYSPEKKGFRVFGGRQLFLKPTSLRFSADTHLVRNESYDVSSSGEQTRRTNTFDKKLNADANIDFQFLDNLRTSHSVTMKRNLSQAIRISGLNVGTETDRGYSNSLNFSPKFGKWLSPQYSFSSSFTDNHGPDVRRVGDPPGVRNIRSNTNQDVRASFDLKKLLGPASPAKRSAKPPSGAKPSAKPQSSAKPDPRERRAPPGSSAGEEDPPPGDWPPSRERSTGDEERRSREDGGEEEAGREPPAGAGARAGGDEASPDADAGEDGIADGESGEGGDEDTEVDREDVGGGPSFGDFVGPVLTFLRSMDAIEGRYSLKWNSRYNRIPLEEVPGVSYKLGLDRGEGADDRTEERGYSLDSGMKLTGNLRVKGSYKRSITGRWYKNTVSDTLDLSSQTESMNETSKGSLSWNGIEKIGPLSGVFTSVRARSGLEYKRSYSGPVDEPTSRGNGLSFNPIVSIDTKFKNGLTANFSWDKRKSQSHSLSGAGSVSEDRTSSTSLTLNYRFSAPHGLKLPFFGQKLKFQSNLDTSLTLRTSSKETRTAQDEASLVQVDPSASSRDFSVTADATYSFSRSVSGGLQVSFSQKRDVKREQTRRTIGMHLTAEFKF